MSGVATIGLAMVPDFAFKVMDFAFKNKNLCLFKTMISEGAGGQRAKSGRREGVDVKR